MPAPARRRSGSTCPTATECTSRPMLAAPGATSVCGDSKFIGRICIHPTNPDLVYAAVLGRRVRTNSERGVYRSEGRRHELAEDAEVAATWQVRSTSRMDPRQSAPAVRLDVGGAAQLLEHIERRPGQRTCSAAPTAGTHGRRSRASPACRTDILGKIGVSISPPPGPRVGPHRS